MSLQYEHNFKSNTGKMHSNYFLGSKAKQVPPQNFAGGILLKRFFC